jgi:hypothetical protein
MGGILVAAFPFLFFFAFFSLSFFSVTYTQGKDTLPEVHGTRIPCLADCFVSIYYTT